MTFDHFMGWALTWVLAWALVWAMSGPGPKQVLEVYWSIDVDQLSRQVVGRDRLPAQMAGADGTRVLVSMRF